MTSKIEKLEKLLEEATPGHWMHDDGQIIFDAPENAEKEDHWCWNSFPVQYWQGFDEDNDDKNKYDSDRDADLICALRNCAPLLLKIVKAAKAVSKVYPDDSNRLHNKLTEALQKFEASEL